MLRPWPFIAIHLFVSVRHEEEALKTRELAQQAKYASRQLATAGAAVKNRALFAMADALERRSAEILVENSEDVTEGRKKGLSSAMIDRLLMDEERLRGIASSLRDIAALADPVGEVVEGHRTPEGLQIEKVRTPFGVIAVVYEARPNVTVDAAALCIKTGNSVILRGGGDAYRSNRILAEVITGAALEAGLPGDCIQFVSSKERDVLVELLQLRDLVDLVIPRGGEGLKEFLLEHSKVPVIYAAGGNCHVYVDQDADLKQALEITINAKCQRPGVCNAAETLLVHQAVAAEFLPAAVKALHDRKVKIYADPATKEVMGESDIRLVRAMDKHYATEFLGLEIAVRVVENLEQAIEHIARYGTGHSEAIITKNLEASRRFAEAVDAAAIYINASTRFTDGAVYGMGAEIGISTQKLHARGPLALKELTTMKYVVTGRGHIR
jgi:glutamate-5-semialdehyde dehydrogenase